MRILFTLLFILLTSYTQSQNIFIRLNGNKAELRQTSGNLIRYIGNNDVVFCDINNEQNYILITTTSGKVELRSSNNNLIRYIGNNNIINARWSGNEIILKTKSGKIEIRTVNNNLIRII